MHLAQLLGRQGRAEIPILLATEEQSKQQIAVFERAFAEDNAMIEAQQRVVDRTPERRMMVLSTDGALNQFRWLMAGLIEAEQQPPSRRAERRFA